MPSFDDEDYEDRMFLRIERREKIPIVKLLILAIFLLALMLIFI